MKKVMFVIGVLSNGGAERVISILAKEMSEQGYEVSITTIFGDNNKYVDDDRISILPIKRNSNNKLNRIIETIFKTRQIIKKNKPDVIISFDAIINIYTLISSFLLRKKLIVSERNDPNQNPGSKILRHLRNFLYRYCDLVVFQTNQAREYFSLDIQKKGIVISNPITPNLPYWNINNQEKTIITACRLSQQKNLPMLINAFSKNLIRIPNYKLKIYGVGELYNDLKLQIEKLGLEDNVFLPGFSNDIHSEMANADLFVISSNYEGISNSMLEALAIGVPVISTDSPIGGARMFIKSGVNGVLTKVGDEENLTDEIYKIISNKDLGAQLSSEAIKIREELSKEVITNKWIKSINNIYGGKYGLSEKNKI